MKCIQLMYEIKNKLAQIADIQIMRKTDKTGDPWT